MPSAWRLSALLGFALLTPVGLPAGGADRRLPEVRRRGGLAEPLLIGDAVRLHCAPRWQAPVLATLEPGATVRVMRQWLAPQGGRWLHVEAVSPAGRPSRGWLAG